MHYVRCICSSRHVLSRCVVYNHTCFTCVHTHTQAEISSSHQLVHSEYLQLLTSLAVGLGLHSVLISPPHPPHFTPSPPTKEWTWLADFTRSVHVAESLTKRSLLPEDVGFKFPSGIPPVDTAEKYQPTVSAELL